MKSAISLPTDMCIIVTYRLSLIHIYSETYKKGAIHSSFFSVLAKGVAFMQHLLIAYYFGANTGTDLYFYLFNLVIICLLYTSRCV